jgi:DNA polymerase III subunit epsilon
MQFVAIDVETANSDMASICQIGVAQFRDGKVVNEWVSYVDPHDFFDPLNVAVHGVDEAKVAGAPDFGQLAADIRRFLCDSIVVSHTHFDRTAIHQACERSSIALAGVRWLDSARVTRRTWKEHSTKGYGLAEICERLGYGFVHHNALEDAKAAGHVLVKAIEESGIDLEGWLKRVRQPIDLSSGEAITREGNPDGALFGEVAVFTGTLIIPRREAADLAARAGCEVASGVNKRTTLLVVGDQDIKRLAGHEKSSKHRKAEDLIERGQEIKILRETDFLALLALDT